MDWSEENECGRSGDYDDDGSQSDNRDRNDLSYLHDPLSLNREDPGDGLSVPAPGMRDQNNFELCGFMRFRK